MRDSLITRVAALALAPALALLLGACAGTKSETAEADASAEVAAAHDGAAEALHPETEPVAGPAHAGLAAERFELLKSLEGAWVLPDGDGAPQLEYEVTANGSAVIETVFPDQDHEMVSVYTLDQGRLVMTHYCAMGNQPYMVASPEGTAEVIRFECLRAGNTESHADAHMHLGIFTIGDGTLKTEWTMYADLEPGQTVGFELVRGGM